MKKLTALIFLLAMGTALIAKAAPPQTIRQTIYGPFYICANDGFRLVQKDDNYYLSGPLYVPTPGYSYAFSDVSASSGVATGTVTITAPKEKQDAPFITPPLQAEYAFTSDETVKQLVISIAKPFDWGDIRIVCTKAG